MTRLGRGLGRAGALRDEAGISAVEFAIIAPSFIILLMGTFDIAHSVYARSLLSGAIEAAARDSALEGGDLAAADQAVEDVLAPILPALEVRTTRLSYSDFSDIGRPERFTDSNDNGTCDNGEPFVDENRSGGWNADVGSQGNGGANDVVLYRVTVEYEPLFMIPFVPERWNDRSMVATAVRRNQPFALQPTYGNTSGNCGV